MTDKQLDVLSGVGRGLSAGKTSLDVAVKRIGRLAELIPDYGDDLRKWMEAPCRYAAGALDEIGKVRGRAGALAVKIAEKATGGRQCERPKRT